MTTILQGIGWFLLKIYEFFEAAHIPAAYALSLVVFTVENTGEVQRVVMYDAPIPTELVTVPKTGDTVRIGPWLGLGAAALGGLCALLIIHRKRGDR